MATQNDFSRSFPVNTPMSAFIRVSISSNGGLQPSGTEQGLGILQEDVLGQSYENPKVRFYGTGSCRVSITAVSGAASAVTAGATLYTAANGQVAPTGTTVWGTLLDASSGSVNGVIVEALPSF